MTEQKCTVFLRHGVYVSQPAACTTTTKTKQNRTEQNSVRSVKSEPELVL